MNSNGAPRNTYHFILDATIEIKRLIKTLFHKVKRFILGSFRCNQPMVIIVSQVMNRSLDGFVNSPKMLFSVIPAGSPG